MQLISKLGTSKLFGLNADFNIFKLLCAPHMRSFKLVMFFFSRHKEVLNEKHLVD